jgi:hypothetical protein
MCRVKSKSLPTLSLNLLIPRGRLILVILIVLQCFMSFHEDSDIAYHGRLLTGIMLQASNVYTCEVGGVLKAHVKMGSRARFLQQLLLVPDRAVL